MADTTQAALLHTHKAALRALEDRHAARAKSVSYHLATRVVRAKVIAQNESAFQTSAFKQLAAASQKNQAVLRSAHRAGAITGRHHAKQELEALGLKSPVVPITDISTYTAAARDALSSSVDATMGKLYDYSASPEEIRGHVKELVRRAATAASVVANRAYTDQQLAMWSQVAQANPDKLLEKVWATNPLSDPCPTCLALDGSVIGLAEQFPHDPTDPVFQDDLHGPPRHPNCRCRLVLRVTDANGSSDPAAESLAAALRIELDGDDLLELHGHKGKPGYFLLHDPNQKTADAATAIYKVYGQHAITPSSVANVLSGKSVEGSVPNGTLPTHVTLPNGSKYRLNPGEHAIASPHYNPGAGSISSGLAIVKPDGSIEHHPGYSQGSGNATVFQPGSSGEKALTKAWTKKIAEANTGLGGEVPPMSAPVPALDGEIPVVEKVKTPEGGTYTLKPGDLIMGKKSGMASNVVFIKHADGTGTAYTSSGTMELDAEEMGPSSGLGESWSLPTGKAPEPEILEPTKAASPKAAPPKAASPKTEVLKEEKFVSVDGLDGGYQMLPGDTALNNPNDSPGNVIIKHADGSVTSYLGGSKEEFPPGNSFMKGILPYWTPFAVAPTVHGPVGGLTTTVPKMDGGYIAVTPEQLSTAIAALKNQAGIYVKQPLAKIKHPLADMDYHAVASLHPEVKAKAGKDKTKQAVIFHLEAQLAHAVAPPPPPPPVTTSFGGVDGVTVAHLKSAHAILSHAKGIMVKQPLTAGSHKLAGMDYHAVAKAHADKTGNKLVGNDKTKKNVIAALDAKIKEMEGQGEDAPSVAPSGEKIPIGAKYSLKMDDGNIAWWEKTGVDKWHIEFNDGFSSPQDVDDLSDAAVLATEGLNPVGAPKVTAKKPVSGYGNADPAGTWFTYGHRLINLRSNGDGTYDSYSAATGKKLPETPISFVIKPAHWHELEGTAPLVPKPEVKPGAPAKMYPWAGDFYFENISGTHRYVESTQSGKWALVDLPDGSIKNDSMVMAEGDIKILNDPTYYKKVPNVYAKPAPPKLPVKDYHYEAKSSGTKYIYDENEDSFKSEITGTPLPETALENNAMFKKVLNSAPSAKPTVPDYHYVGVMSGDKYLFDPKSGEFRNSVNHALYTEADLGGNTLFEKVPNAPSKKMYPKGGDFYYTAKSGGGDYYEDPNTGKWTITDGFGEDSHGLTMKASDLDVLNDPEFFTKIPNVIEPLSPNEPASAVAVPKEPWITLPNGDTLSLLPGDKVYARDDAVVKKAVVHKDGSATTYSKGGTVSEFKAENAPTDGGWEPSFVSNGNWKLVAIHPGAGPIAADPTVKDFGKAWEDTATGTIYHHLPNSGGWDVKESSGHTSHIDDDKIHDDVFNSPYYKEIPPPGSGVQSTSVMGSDGNQIKIGEWLKNKNDLGEAWQVTSIEGTTAHIKTLTGTIYTLEVPDILQGYVKVPDPSGVPPAAAAAGDTSYYLEAPNGSQYHKNADGTWQYVDQNGVLASPSQSLTPEFEQNVLNQGWQKVEKGQPGSPADTSTAYDPWHLVSPTGKSYYQNPDGTWKVLDSDGHLMNPASKKTSQFQKKAIAANWTQVAAVGTPPDVPGAKPKKKTKASKNAMSPADLLEKWPLAPPSGYKATEISAQYKQYVEQLGLKNQSITPGFMDKNEKSMWLSHMYNGDFGKAYQLELSEWQYHKHPGEDHPHKLTHPGSPDNPLNNGDYPPKMATPAAVEGEVPAGVIVPGNWPDVYSWDSDQVDAYLLAAGMKNSAGLNNWQKKQWVNNHKNGDKKSTDAMSLLAQKNYQNGNYQSEEITPPKPIIPVGQVVPFNSDWKPFNKELNHAINLDEPQTNDYLSNLLTNKAFAKAKQQDLKVRQAIVQQHWLAGNLAPGDEKDKAYTSAEAVLKELEHSADSGEAPNLPTFGEKHSFSLKSVQPNLPGYGKKSIVVDEHGNDWIFKYDKEGGWRSDVEGAAHDAAHFFGFGTAPGQIGQFQGHKGFYQVLVPNDGDTSSGAPSTLTPTQIKDVAAEHLLDWLLDNDDAHNQNFLLLPNGHVLGIDKGRAWKHLGEGGHAHTLDWPGKMSNNAHLYYEDLYNDIADGKIDQATVDATYRHVMNRAKSMSRRSDESYRALLEGSGLKSRPGYGKPLVDSIIARKNSLTEDFDKLWSTIYEKAGLTKPDLTTNAVENTFTGTSPELLDAVKTNQVHGNATFFGGKDLEDGHLLLYETQTGKGESTLYAQGQLREEAGAAWMKWVKEHGGNGLKISSSTYNEPVHESNSSTQATQWNNVVLKAAKTISHHQMDKEYNQGTLDEFEKLKTDLSDAQAMHPADLNPWEYEEHANMVAHYNAQIAFVEALKADGSKSKPGDITPFTWVDLENPLGDEPAAPVLKVDYKVSLGTGHLPGGSVNDKGELVAGTPTTKGQSNEYVIELPSGAKIHYVDHDDGVLTQKGRVRIEVEDHEAHGAALDEALDTLRMAGISLDPAEESDLELMYWRHLHGVISDRLDGQSGGKYKVLVQTGIGINNAKGQDPATELLAWQNAFRTQFGAPIIDDWIAKSGYLPHYRHNRVQNSDLENGRPYWERFDVSAADIAGQRTVRHRMHNGDASALGIVLLGGLLPTEERTRQVGAWLSGMSSTEDQGYGSANFLFTRQNHGTGTHQEGESNSVVIRADVKSRTSNYAFPSDTWGKHFMRKSESSFEFSVDATNSGSTNELMLKYGVSLLDDIEAIPFISPTVRQQAIDHLHNNGIYEIRGIPVEERLLPRDGFNAAVIKLMEKQGLKL